MIAKPLTPANTFLFVGVVLGCGLLIIALGIIETVGIFGMVFGLAILNKAG